MTPRQIGALIVAAALVLACALIRLAPRLLGALAHRGEADDAPDPIDRAYAQTCAPHPTLCRCPACTAVVTDLDWQTFAARTRADHLVWRAAGGCGDTEPNRFPDWSNR